MRLRDGLNAVVQAFREAPDLRAQLAASEYQRSLAEQMLELRERECEGLHSELREKDDRLRFLYARADALSSALTLKEFFPRLSTTEEMKRFYDAVSRSLDPSSFTLHHVAERLAGVDTVSLFPYEAASGRELLKYLTAYCFGAVEWEIVPYVLLCIRHVSSRLDGSPRRVRLRQIHGSGQLSSNPLRGVSHAGDRSGIAG